MPPVQFSVPTLVKEVKTETQSMFHIQPLFLTYPKVTNKHYGTAMAQYKKTLQNNLQDLMLQREELNYSLWYNFSPALTYSAIDLTIKLGQQVIEGTFGVTTFQMDQLNFVHLPTLQNYMFISEVDIKDKKALKIELEEIVKRKNAGNKEKHK
ncbi:MAG: hypothetical protein HC912_06830 [Saprospiraceae bacterium]|nr:hypothetical protein [Saprospiraceae bacterium]